MVSMKRKKKSTKSLKNMPECGSMHEDYPYSLKITLEKDELKKLGIGLKDYDVDDSVTFKVEAKVIAIRSSDSTYGDSSESVELQIVGMEFNPHKPKKIKGY